MNRILFSCADNETHITDHVTDRASSLDGEYKKIGVNSAPIMPPE